VEGPTAEVEVAILGPEEVVWEHDSQDAGSILLHLSPSLVPVLRIEEVASQVRDVGNCSNFALLRSHKVLLTIYRKLVMLSCMVYRISANLYRGDCWDRSSCILCYHLS
jgi:hypothetical protein